MLIKDLFQRYRVKPKGILHVGAHLAQERGIYKDAGVPDDKMFWVEANPKIFLDLIETVSVKQAFNFCVSDTNGEVVRFNISSNDGQSSSFLDFGTHIQQHPSVKFIDAIELITTRLDFLFGDLYERPDVDFLVMDIQGAELKALKGMGDWLNSFQWCYLEVNREEVYKGCGQVDEVDEYLGRFNFSRIESKWHGGWGDAYYTKTKTQ